VDVAKRDLQVVDNFGYHGVQYTGIFGELFFGFLQARQGIKFLP
jgi:hypothetical protein